MLPDLFGPRCTKNEPVIVVALSSDNGLPRAALLAAAEQRDRLAPRFMRLIEDYLDLPAP